MTGSVAIDVSLGLSFIFLLYSLLATIIQEMISRWLGLRARMLLKSIAKMLDDQEPAGRFQLFNYLNESWKNLKYFFDSQFNERPVTRLFYQHPTIKYLGEDTWSSKPSYLSATAFSQTLVDILRDPEGINQYDGTQNQMELIRNTLNNDHLNYTSSASGRSDTLRQLKIFAAESKDDVVKFKALLEQWFAETQDRCTSWFKKQTQFILLLIGFGIALTFNVDAIGIVKILSVDTKARQQLVDLATSSYQKFNSENKENKIDSTTSEKALNDAYGEVMKSINESNSILGLGWDSSCSLAIYQPTFLSQLVGWLITTFAISLGAPFWFDILNKIMALRASRKPEEIAATLPIAATTSPNNRVG